ncbi:hypothetical protein PR048_000229 [Dryococelus australis]|uniref:HAT C-terminal dimerisation domain-containing protein n=1 Tax=Dryococelus australis TaxID=614101 RepID=A0ABQ9IEM4_9NEOP|nr:hypothetical protein PR048_000229 [Dryococelus australis]
MTAHEIKTLANLIKDYIFLNAVCMIRKAKEYFEKSRTEDKFKSYLIDSKELASELELEDMTIGGTITARRRKKPNDSFDFLYDISTLKDMPSDVLSKKCSKLSSILQDNDSKYVNGDELCDELKVLSTLLTPGIGPAETLKFIEQYNLAPNVGVELRILLTLPVTVASDERSFSKLKLIKTYLRSTMLQSRLSGLAMILTEHQLAEK